MISMTKIKNSVCFVLLTLLVLGVSVGCKSNGNHTDTEVRVSEMKYTLTDGDIDQFYKKLDKCREIFESEDKNREKELDKALDEMFKAYEGITIQRDIAEALYDCDYSNKEMNENSLYASSMVNKTYGDLTAFVDSGKHSSNPLADVLDDFADRAFTTPVVYRYGDAQTPYNESVRIIHEYNNLGSSASDGYKCELYNRYLDALNEYASAYAFPNYYEKANQANYFRDYEKRDRKNIRNYVKEYLVPLLREVEKRYDDLNVSSEAYAFSSRLLDSNYDKLPKNYLFAYSKSLPKDMADIMNMPFEQDLILVGNKSTSANTAYVGRIGNQHFIYFNSSKMDLDTVVHELGHFYSDSISGGYVSFDVGEVHSIANHLLFIKFLENEVDKEAYKDYYMYSVDNILYQAVSCAIKDEFEETLLIRAKYDDFTLEELDEIMSGLIDEYGVRDISSKMVDQLMTFWKRLGFNDVGYKLSYTSATVASMQIFVKSFEDYDGAVKIYKSVCEDIDRDGTFVKTIRNAGLYAPFEKEAYTEIQKLLDYYGK